MPHYPTRSFTKAWMISLTFIVLLWIIHSLALFNSFDIWNLGINPKVVSGLPGILLAPLIHGDWEHLAANTPALVILISALYYGYPRAASPAIIVIWLISGFLTWLFAQAGTVHYGASGLTHGLMFFLFTIGILRRDRLSIALSMVVFFLYGGMIWSILPSQPNISFEMHLSGAIVGLVIAFLFRGLDIPFPVKHYDWENEDSDVIDKDSDDISINSNTDSDIIGESWITDTNKAEPIKIEKDPT